MTAPRPGPPADRAGRVIAYRVAQAADAIGIGRSLMTELIAAGEIPAIKLGRATLVRRADLEAYLDRQPPVTKLAHAAIKPRRRASASPRR